MKTQRKRNRDTVEWNTRKESKSASRQYKKFREKKKQGSIVCKMEFIRVLLTKEVCQLSIKFKSEISLPPENLSYFKSVGEEER